MIARTLRMPVMFSVVAALCMVPAVAQDDKDPSEPQDPPKLSDADLKNALKQAASLGKGHSRLKTIRKQYTQEIKYWRSADAAPLESKGKSETKRILIQRFLTQTIDAHWMEQAFEGLAMVGFDNPTGEYILTWQSSLHTDIFIARGKAPEKGKEITFFGDYRDPVSGDTQKLKVVLKILNKKGETLITAFDVTSPENEFKFLEVQSKRLLRAAA